MKKLRLLLILGFVVWAGPTTVSAQRLGINFTDTVDLDASILNPTDMAGVVPQANWNNMMDANGTDVGGLVLDNGTASGVTVSWSSPNTWSSTRNFSTNNQFADPANLVLMTGYIDSNDGAAVSMVQVNNIDAALRTPSYDVYVYFLGDSGDNRGGGYTLTPVGGSPIVKYGSTMAMPTEHVEDLGTDIDNSVDGTYLRYTGLTGSSFSLTGDARLTTPNGFRAPINAVQIVRSTLTPGDVNGDGLVNINDFHIIRSNLFKTGQTRAMGDLISDGTVDFADFREWKRLAPPGVAASASLSGAIPEPSTSMLLAISAALAALAAQRTKRVMLRCAS